MLKILRNLFFIFCIHAPFFVVYGQTFKSDIPLIRNYSYKNYSASPQNWGIVQDKHGVMYFANEYGILDFDGNNWRLNGLVNRVPPRSIAIGESEKIFIGGYADFGYMRKTSQGMMEYISFKDLIDKKYQNFEDVWSIYPTSDAVFFCTAIAIYKYANGKIEVFPVPNPQRALSYFVHGKLYVSVPGNGIYEFRANKLVLIPNSATISQLGVMAMMEADNNKILIATQRNNIFEYDGFTTFRPWANGASSWLKQNNINTAIAIDNGYVLGSVQNGLLIIDRNGQPRQHLYREKGLQNNAIQNLYQDLEGNLWIASNKGIDYVQINSPFSFLNAKGGLPGIGYASLLYKGKKYWCTSEGLYVSQDMAGLTGSGMPTFKLVENTQGIAYNIQEIEGNLLLSHHNGPYLVEGNTATKLSDQNGAWLFKPLKKYPEYIICGGYTGLSLFKKSEGRLQFLWNIDGFPESSRIMEEDDEGNLWIAHGYKGLYKIELTSDLKKVDKLDFYDQQDGFPSNFFINVFKIDDKLVFTGERGIFSYDKKTNKFVPNTTFSKVFEAGKHIRKLKEDKEGNIWFSVGDQMGYLKKKANGSYTVEQSLFNPLQGSLVGGFEYFGFPDKSEVIIGTEEGFIVFRPAQIQNARSSPEFHTLIRNVKTNDGQKDSLIYGGDFADLTAKISHTDTLKTRVSYSSNSLKFIYSAASYVNIERIQYQYFLEGYDKSWSDWTTATLKEYTHLQEGSYTFHVRARDINNKESIEASYPFSISPPWYRSVYAFLFYFFCLIALSVWLRRVFIARENRTKQRLKEEQEKALRLKEAEYNETVLKAEKEIIKLNSEKLSNELEHKNKELASSAMHIMKRVDSNEKIREQLDHINEKIGDQAVSNQLRQVIKSLQEDILFDNNWEQFEMHFNQTHHDFLHRVRVEFPQLTHQDIRLLAYLRMNLSSKEIASLMNLSLRSIENNRYRIRKKMDLDQAANLSEFILRF